jgi:hypothetical protein
VRSLASRASSAEALALTVDPNVLASSVATPRGSRASNPSPSQPRSQPRRQRRQRTTPGSPGRGAPRLKPSICRNLSQFESVRSPEPEAPERASITLRSKKRPTSLSRAKATATTGGSTARERMPESLVERHCRFTRHWKSVCKVLNYFLSSRAGAVLL